MLKNLGITYYNPVSIVSFTNILEIIHDFAWSRNFVYFIVIERWEWQDLQDKGQGFIHNNS